MREFKKPNLSAPRFRPTVYTIMNKEFFDSFKKKYPKYKNLDEKSLRKIAKTFNELVYTTVIENRDGMQLPESIGWLFIGSCQQSKKENIDYAKSNKYGVSVTNKNWESDGKLAKIFFTSYALKHKMKNREFWKFIACRDFKRSIAKVYQENWNMYMSIDPSKKLKLDYQKTIYKNFLNDSVKKELNNYNDFDL